MRVTQDDFKNKNGEWVQRAYINDKYVWTTSGVLWNNVKERCTIGGATQTREPTYIGCVNGFDNYQNFANWHVKQVGYGLGYQLDADILKPGNKIYSETTCVLIPPALNKFLQSTTSKRGLWPQGICLDGKNKKLLQCRENKNYIGRFTLDEVDKARELYRISKNKSAQSWYDRLSSKEFTVDPRVVEYMKNWRHVCDWVPQ